MAEYKISYTDKADRQVKVAQQEDIRQANKERLFTIITFYGGIGRR